MGYESPCTGWGQQGRRHLSTPPGVTCSLPGCRVLQNQWQGANPAEHACHTDCWWGEVRRRTSCDSMVHRALQLPTSQRWGKGSTVYFCFKPEAPPWPAGKLLGRGWGAARSAPETEGERGKNTPSSDPHKPATLDSHTHLHTCPLAPQPTPVPAIPAPYTTAQKKCRSQAQWKATLAGLNCEMAAVGSTRLSTSNHHGRGRRGKI